MLALDSSVLQFVRSADVAKRQRPRSLSSAMSGEQRCRARACEAIRAELTRTRQQLDSVQAHFASKVAAEVRSALATHDAEQLETVRKMAWELSILRSKSRSEKHVRVKAAKHDALRAQLKAATTLNVRTPVPLPIKECALLTIKYCAESLDAKTNELESVRAASTKELESLRAELDNQDQCTMDAKDLYDEATEEAERLAAELKKSNQQAKELQTTAVAQATRQVEAIARAAASSREANLKQQEDLQEELTRMEELVKELEEKSADLKAAQMKAPKSYTEEEWAKLSYNGKATARHRAVHTFCEFLELGKWRPADVATALQRCDLLEDLWETREVWALRMEWARTIFGMCMSTHWGVRLGLHLVLVVHLPTHLIRRLGQVSCKDYDGQTNTYKPRLLLFNPHLATDI
eukprot:651050-Pleurochrysis_carterae.AAC.2